MPAIRVVQVSSKVQLGDALAIRRTVFVDEQGVSEELEFDGRDREARHFLALIEGRAVGALRLRLLDHGRIAKIERVAVLAPERSRRVGRALMDAVLASACSLGARQAVLHAQVGASGFYAGFGFEPNGAAFEEDGIAHVAMRLDLADAESGAAGPP
ncbi:MAG: GNAT family N-acetyltransferase [Geminicoccaceae bacterium]